MNYFIDTEFSENGETIDLISIGIVCEDGREFYHLNRDCDMRKAWRNEWVRDNVLAKIYAEKVHGDMQNVALFSRSTMRWLFNTYGLSKRSIAHAALDFMGFESEWGERFPPNDEPVIWGYFADYDWVAFCQLFGRMIDLPKGMPFFCMDLKQSMKERGLTSDWKNVVCPDPVGEHNALVDARWNLSLWREVFAAPPTSPYPTPTD